MQAWTLIVALVVGLVVGFVAARLTGRHAAPAEMPAPPEIEAAPEPEPSEPPEAAAQPQAVHIGMEDVVSELERRYQGRRVDPDPEK